MSGTAILCAGIGKRYRIGQQHRYKALRDTLADGLRAPLRRVNQALRKVDRAEPTIQPEFLWALKDFSVEVPQGEVLGIIGRNGAGKSTLLKILSRITSPTEGRAEIRGRVGALLEVGTGFHPELTGRENIYFNGVVLGMSKREIDRRFDEIVDFSECSRFLDMPVKHYSSGMHMRLAFSVAAHLDTEILFVDEVLAVGDSAFQKKCLGKMGDAAHQGRTVLFVSHNLVAIESLCTRAVCLHEGRIVAEGAPGDVVSRYLRQWVPTLTEVRYEDAQSAPGNELFRLRRACVRAIGGATSDPITVQKAFVVEFEYWKPEPAMALDLGVDVHNEQGVHLFNTGRYGEPPAPAGLLRSSFVVPGDLLNKGTHRIELTVYLGGLTEIFHVDDLLAFEVHDAPGGQRGLYHGPWYGAVRPCLEWTTEVIEPMATKESKAAATRLPAPVSGPRAR